jgi:hypothetical protein
LQVLEIAQTRQRNPKESLEKLDGKRLEKGKAGQKRLGGLQGDAQGLARFVPSRPCSSRASTSGRYRKAAEDDHQTPFFAALASVTSLK